MSIISSSVIPIIGGGGPTASRDAVTITNYGVTFDSSTKKIGSHSANFGYNQSDYLLTDLGPDMQGLDEFTVEGWFYVHYDARNTTQMMFSANKTSGDSNIGKLFLQYNGSQQGVRFYYNGSYTSSVGYISIPNSQWVHIVCQKKTNGTMQLFIDGTKEVDISCGNDNYPSDRQFDIGRRRDNNSQHFNGYMDDLRFSSVARYFSDFTPSTSAFQNDSDTMLLLHYDNNFDDDVY